MIPLSLGFISGHFAAFFLCVSGFSGEYGFVFLCTFACVIGFLSMLLKVGFRARVMVFSASFAIAVALSGLHTALRLTPLERLDGTTAEVTGRVISATLGDRSAVTVSGKVNGIHARILVYINGFNGQIGDEISLIARVSKHDNSPFFRAREYYLPDGIMLTGSSAEVISLEHKTDFISLIRSCSDHVSQKIRREIGGEAGELMAAMITGDRTAFSDSLRTKLNRTGVGHLAAVSGLHVSVVAGAVLYFTRKINAPKLLSAAVSELCMIGFIIFAGLRISAIRAGLMMSVVILGSLIRRRTDALNTICLCGLIITTTNPYAAGDSSLILSLSGVFGAAVLSKAAAKEFGLRRKIPKALAVSVSAFSATAPFMTLWFDEIPLLSPFMSLITVPACSLALVLGMLYTSTGCAFQPLIKLAGWICGAVIKLCDHASTHFAFSIPVGYKTASYSVVIGAVLCITVFLLTKAPRTTALLAAMCIAVTISAYSIEAVFFHNSPDLFAISSNGSHGLVLRKNTECFIVDLSGGLFSDMETVLARNGITDVIGVIICENAEAGYSAYANLSPAPKTIILPDDSYVFGGNVDCVNIPFGSSISVFGAEIFVLENRIRVTFDGEDISAASGFYAGDGSISISFFDNLTVIDDGCIAAYNGDICLRVALG